MFPPNGFVEANAPRARLFSLAARANDPQMSELASGNLTRVSEFFDRDFSEFLVDFGVRPSF
jgi:hypothetical protein